MVLRLRTPWQQTNLGEALSLAHQGLLRLPLGVLRVTIGKLEAQLR
jgi:hypothetical protein